MSNLRELFDDAVVAPPPSRLRAADILSAARSRRRRRTSVAVLAGLVATAVVGASGVALSRGTTDIAPSGAAPPGRVQWAAAAGATQVYALLNTCDPTPTATGGGSDCYRLIASADNGAGWSADGRLPDEDLPFVEVLGDHTLLSAFVRVAAGATATEPADMTFVGKVSEDGGRHWAELTEGPPIGAVPPGGAAISFTWGAAAAVKVYDPATLRLRPLTHQPGLLRSFVLARPTGQGIWVTGYDPATRRPAVAVSHNGGVAWTTTVFDGPVLPARADVDAVPPLPFTRDGVVAYVLLPPLPGSPLRYRVARSTDGGRTFGPATVDAVLPEYSSAWVTADGRLVACEDPPSHRCRVSADGRDFIDATPPGLADDAKSDGVIGYTSTTIYRSDDGWTWRPIGP